ncbi:MAG: AMP-binding protein [Chloroflexi bacterium]|nr:AMP-binding protein [Chloroflexota bacterium]
MEKRYYTKYESMSREDFKRWQWKTLKEQIDYSYAHSGLCQRQFKQARITPDDIKTPEDFANKVPFTTKQDLLADQKERPPFGTRLSVPEKEVIQTFLTSGTSGKGQEVHTFTRADWEAFYDIVSMIYYLSGWVPGDRTMNPLPLGTTIAAPTHYLGPLKLGCEVFNLGTYDTKTKLDYMQRFNLTCIFATPAYLETLTAEAENMGISPAKDLKVRKILTAIQAYPVSFIHKIEDKWNAKVYDYYGSTQYAEGSTCEKGAVQGEQRGFYHLYEHVSYLEILNPETGKPAEPGEFGEVVTTPLNRKASPYLRFKLLDRARYFPHNACDCGRPFSLAEAGTVSRYDDMMKIKGVNIWPETIDELVFTKDETYEYQGRVFISDDRKEKAEIVVEFKPGIAAEVRPKVLAKIADDIRDRTGIGFDVKEAKQPLPHAVFKVRRWTDERAKGLEKKA